jgi:hypothetical protein
MGAVLRELSFMAHHCDNSFQLVLEAIHIPGFPTL